MRTLELNKTDIWYVSPDTEIEVLDEDGYFTGEITRGFGTPIKTRLHLYPATGDVVDRVFGTNISVDMVTSSNDVVLSKDTLLFLSEPISDYDTTYDYKVGKILKSLNSYQYGLNRRI